MKVAGRERQAMLLGPSHLFRSALAAAQPARPLLEVRVACRPTLEIVARGSSIISISER